MKYRELAVIIFLAILLIPYATAFAVSPPRIILEDVPKEVSVTKEVTISGIAPGSTIEINTRGEAAAWIASSLGNSFVFPDTDKLKIPFVITVPSQAANGEYKVIAHVTAAPKKEEIENLGASVATGAFVEINFTVTGKQVKKYAITTAKFRETEVGAPIFLVMQMSNEGNVLAKPTGAVITIKDKTKTEILAVTDTKKISAINPFSVGESIAEFSTQLPAGQYFVDVDLFDGKEKVKEYKNLFLEVVEKGTINIKGKLLDLSVKGNAEKIAKLQATFLNTGENDVYGTFVGEVYKDGALSEIIRGDSEYISGKNKKILVHYYEVPGPGAYTIKGHIEFGNKKTAQKTVAFTSGKGAIQVTETKETKEKGKKGKGSGSKLMYFLLILLIMLLALKFSVKSKKGKRK